MQGIRYRRKATPGRNGKLFKVVLNELVKKGSILTYDLDHGHLMMVWKLDSKERVHYMKLVTQNEKDFFPPEFLKANTELFIINSERKVKIL